MLLFSGEEDGEGWGVVEANGDGEETENWQKMIYRRGDVVLEHCLPPLAGERQG